MKILVLGGTGGVGLAFIDECLKAQHEVVVYARSPDKIPESITSHHLVSVHKGSITDADAMKSALNGVHAVISALGPSVSKGPMHPSDTPLAKAYSQLLNLMQEVGVKRLIALGTASNTDTNDKASATFWALVKGVDLFAHSAYKDVIAIGDTIRAQPELLYTLARVPILTNSPGTTFHAGYIGDGGTKAHLSRKAYAAFVVSELSKNEWIRKAPMISSE